MESQHGYSEPQMQRLDGICSLYIVNVPRQDGMWIAECDDLGLVTEATTYDALTERVWEVMPELMADNLPGVDLATVLLSFQHTELATVHLRAN